MLVQFYGIIYPTLEGVSFFWHFLKDCPKSYIFFFVPKSIVPVEPMNTECMTITKNSASDVGTSTSIFRLQLCGFTTRNICWYFCCFPFCQTQYHCPIGSDMKAQLTQPLFLNKFKDKSNDPNIGLLHKFS